MCCKLIAFVLITYCLFYGVHSSTHPSFVQWKSEAGRVYENHIEEQYRAFIYAKNVQQIQQNNNDPSLTHKEAVNQFTDITQEEFRLFYLTFLPPIVGEQDKPIIGQQEDHPMVGKNQQNLIVAPTNQEDNEDSEDSEDISDDDTPILKVNPINWNTIYPQITVEDQGKCGACYAFSAMTVVSYAVIMEFNVTNIFSKQELVDCSQKYGNNGCDGGNMVYCYKYGKKYNIQSQSDYPYTAIKGTCKRDATKAGKYKIASYKKYKGCKKMLNQIQKSPLAVAVDATKWASYSNGVFSNCGKDVNHAVSLVGVVQQTNWIIQNSWGTKWGQNGFITLAIGNTCGICKYPGSFVYPTD